MAQSENNPVMDPVLFCAHASVIFFLIWEITPSIQLCPWHYLVVWVNNKLTEKIISSWAWEQFSSDSQNPGFAGRPSRTSLIILQTIICQSKGMLAALSSSSLILRLCVLSSVTKFFLYSKGSSNVMLSSKSTTIISWVIERRRTLINVHPHDVNYSHCISEINYRK